jgi:hypothetical protein
VEGMLLQSFAYIPDMAKFLRFLELKAKIEELGDV